MRKGNLIVIVVCMMIAASISAQTIVPGGNVSGTWTAVGSPYLIQGEITVHQDSNLTIEPGVEVIFQGHYKFIVNGYLNAIGTEQDSILFTAADTSDGWRGIRFINTASGSQLSFCIIQHGKATTWTIPGDDCGGGIYCELSNPFINHCTISENSASGYGGGIYCQYFNPTISHCTISRNTASFSGGIYCGMNSFPIISHCTITGNTVTLGLGGGISCYISAPTIVNTIVYGNIGNGGINFWSSSDASITYGDFYNNVGGNFTGNVPLGLGIIDTINANGDTCDVFFNIVEDPLFVDPVAGDFHLQASSPCIDAGDPASPPDPDSTIADIGALYFDQGTVPQVSITLTPYGLPIYIPATGGSFDYNIAAANNGASTVTTDIWCMVTLPNGSSYGPVLGPVNVTMPAGFSANRDRAQYVPIRAPEGNYMYRAYIGTYPNVIIDQDSFPFMKVCDHRDQVINNWQNTGESFDE